MKKNFTIDGIEFTVSASSQKVCHKRFATGYSGDPTHYTYSITVRRGETSESFGFHDSIRNYQDGIGATEEMLDSALYSIVEDAFAFLNSRNAQDFADEFGYDYWGEQKRVLKIWDAIVENGKKVSHLFSTEELEKISKYIREIV